VFKSNNPLFPGRHKARIFLRISIQGVHILEDGTMKQIDIHDLDKISYLAEDVDDRKVEIL